MLCLIIVTNHTFAGDSWILVPSVTPSEVKTSTQSALNTTLEIKVAPTQATLPMLPENITNEITLSGEMPATEKISETTLEPSSSEEVDDSSDELVAVTGSSSEYPTESEEEEEDQTTIEPADVAETEPTNINLTSSTITQFGNKHNSYTNCIHARFLVNCLNGSNRSNHLGMMSLRSFHKRLLIASFGER